MKVSQHFNLAEFDCRDGTPVPPRGIRALTNVAAWWLEPMREEFGPVTVHSGFRTPSYNRQVGGALHSVHLLQTPLPGRGARSSTLAAAADVSCRDGGVLDWALWAKRHRIVSEHLAAHVRGGIGVYASQGFVHLDTSTRRDWTG